MAAEMKVTAQAVQAAQDAYYVADDSGSCQYAMTKALEAGLAAMLEPVLAEYQRMQEGVGGCTDGGCVIKLPKGMHTNGGCKCWQDRIKAQRMMRAGQKLYQSLRGEQ